jgi:hypothetical protein
MIRLRNSSRPTKAASGDGDDVLLALDGGGGAAASCGGEYEDWHVVGEELLWCART